MCLDANRNWHTHFDAVTSEETMARLNEDSSAVDQVELSRLSSDQACSLCEAADVAYTVKRRVMRQNHELAKSVNLIHICACIN